MFDCVLNMSVSLVVNEVCIEKESISQILMKDNKNSKHYVIVKICMQSLREFKAACEIVHF